MASIYPVKNPAFGIILITVFLLAWSPFLVLSFYNVPIGMHEWEWMTDYAGRFSGSWWELQQHLYSNVMGRFTSNALLSLTSAWCTLSTFPLFFFFWQIGWFLSILILLRTIFKKYSWWLSIGLSIGIQVLYLFQIEDVYDSLFRYTALLTYQAGTVFSILAAILFFRYDNSIQKNKALLFGGFVMLALAVGTNEISMLFVLIVTSVLFLYHKVFSKKKSSVFLVALIITILASFAVILAPGNGLRMESEDGGMNLLQLALLSISTSIFIWIDWIGSIVFILMTILAIPFIARFLKFSSLPTIFNDYRPWVFILISFVPASMLLLTYSTGGNAFPERVIDHLFIHVIFVWFGFIISIVNHRKFFEALDQFKHNNFVKLSYAVCASVIVLHIFFSGLDIDRTNKSKDSGYLALIQSESNILNAWLALIKGDAANYYNESMNEFRTLYKCLSPTCFVRKPSVIPEQLYDPLSDRRNRNGDGYMGYYFDPRIKVVKYIQPE